MIKIKVKAYKNDEDKIVTINAIGKLKYIGETFGAMSLTNNKEYYCISIKPEFGLLEIKDDSGEVYTYQIENPRPLDGSSKGGKWKIIEDKDNILKETFDKLGISIK